MLLSVPAGIKRQLLACEACDIVYDMNSTICLFDLFPNALLHNVQGNGCFQFFSTAKGIEETLDLRANCCLTIIYHIILSGRH